ncbi:MAG: excinuclease ABC subunit UvrC [Defluviitaleaceae bacterium]|nr:excinuclease ABC subunit UvrC [Defluviitaleaceae bacterium]
MFNIPEELKKLPSLPGVYIMKDMDDKIIYVGKAKSLKNRVKSYFQKTVPDIKTAQLAKRITHFEYVVTDTENEAFILENTLIKQHLPKYNIRLKDGKSYPYIKITAERLPRVLYSHKRGKDKARYFGPFVSGGHVHELLELIHRLWPLRRCAKLFPRDFDKGRPCLNHHIGQCKAPCCRLLAEDEYDEFAREAEQFIRGKTSGVAERLSREMHEAAEKMEYERAAEIRDTINSLKILTEKQKTEVGRDDRDYIAIARQDDEALMQIFFVRGGKLVGREHFITVGISSDEDDSLEGRGHASGASAEGNAQSEANAEAMSAFIKQFYGEAAVIPKEIVVSEAAEKDSIAAWLSERAGRQVAIVVPKIGEKLKMLKLAQTNAELTMSQFGAHIKREAERTAAAVSEIAAALGFDGNFTRIEAYDISNIQGYESVGSMVVFENGKAKPNDYRKFRMKTVVGPDDYAAMEEILSRRFKRFNENSEAFSVLPDVIFVDGGKGQISAAEKALAAQNISVPVCGMVKDERHRTRGIFFENKEITLPRHGEGFKLLTRIQDEVHRFALEYHRKLRADSQTRSVLDEIPGIGKTRRKELLKHFKSIDAIRAAKLDELCAAPSMNKKAAEAVFSFFDKER